MRYRIVLLIILSLLSQAIAQPVVSIKNATYVDMGTGIVTGTNDSIIDFYCSTSDGPYYMCITLEIEDDSLLKSMERYKGVSTSPILFYLWMKSSKCMIPLYGGPLILHSNNCYEQKLIADIPSKYFSFKRALVVQSILKKHKSNKLRKKLQEDCLLYYYEYHTSFYIKITSIRMMIADSDEEKNIFLESYPHISNNVFDF